jgi:hypothetical protein
MLKHSTHLLPVSFTQVGCTLNCEYLRKCSREKIDKTPLWLLRTPEKDDS